MFRRSLLILAALAAIAAAAAFLFVRRRPAPAPAAQASPTQPMASELSLAGRVRARTVVPIAAPVEGVLDELQVQIGEQVYEGQVIAHIKNAGIEDVEQTAAREAAQAEERLAGLQTQLLTVRLDSARARAEAARAAGEFDRAEKFYLRQQNLLKEGATPRLVYEKAEKDLQARRTERDTAEEAAKAAEDRLATLVKRIDTQRAERDEKNQALDAAKARADATQIRAPAAGVLISATRNAGDQVTPDIKNLFEIATNLAELEVVIEPDPQTLKRIEQGAEAQITFADVPDALAGKVKEITANQAVVEFSSPNPTIKPGITAQVKLKLQ